MFKRILVPLDGSPVAEQALPYAVWLGQQAGAELILVRVVPSAVTSPPRYSIAEAEAWLMRQAEKKQEAEAYLAALAKRPDLRSLRVRHLVFQGTTEETILSAIEHVEADAVVVSTRGRSGLVRWLLGSVADHIVKHASVPVLLVRSIETPPQEEAGG
jgi:nucleotide-binding universal stress UspA family protein